MYAQVTRYKGLSKEDIKKIDCVIIERLEGKSNLLYEFEESRFFEADDFLLKQLREYIEDKEKLHIELSEMHIICEMALRYLDVIEERRKNNG